MNDFASITEQLADVVGGTWRDPAKAAMAKRIEAKMPWTPAFVDGEGTISTGLSKDWQGACNGVKPVTPFDPAENRFLDEACPQSSLRGAIF